MNKNSKLNIEFLKKKYKIQKGGIEYSIKSIQISTINKYLQISQLCVYNREKKNIAIDSCEIMASPHYVEDEREGDKFKAIDGNCSSRDFPDIYQSHSNKGKQFWKIIFNELQTYVDIVYYNRNCENNRMDGGKLELFDNDEKILLSFDMTGEFIQEFSNDQINSFLIKRREEEHKKAEEELKVYTEYCELKKEQAKVVGVKEEEIININIWENKSGLIWCFDEVIDEKTDFEGNTREQALKEIIILIKHLLLNNKYDENIDEDILEIFINLLTNNTYLIEYYTKYSKGFDNFLDDEPIRLLICGWHYHSILLFFEKKENDMYNVGMINCGDGAQFQGIFNELCNGIIIFKNISKINLLNFLKYYNFFYLKHHRNNSFNCTLFYFIIFDKLLNKKKETQIVDEKKKSELFYNIDEKIKNECEDKDPKNYEFYINFKELIEEGIIEVFKIHLQLIGSCTFTNSINFIYYLYCTRNIINSLEGYQNYMNWYLTCKSYLKNKLFESYKKYNNQISDIYNIIHYINPSEWYNIVIDDEQKKKIENKIFFNLSSNLLFTNDIINRDQIVNIICSKNILENIDNLREMLNYFFDNYLFDNDFKINNYLYENLHRLYNRSIEDYSVINKNIMVMKIFYLNNLFIEDHIYFLEIYKLYKDNICDFEENMEEYKKFIKVKSDDFLNLTLLFFICGKKQKDCKIQELYISEDEKTKQNKFDLYLKIIGNYDIINKKYIPVIDELKKDLFDNIDIFPPSTNGFYNFSRDKIYLHIIDIPKVNKKIFYNFFGLEISYIKDISIYSKIYSLITNDEGGEYEIMNKIYHETTINNNIIFINKYYYNYPVGKYYAFIHKIKFYLQKLEDILINNIDNEKKTNSSFISKYFAYFYLSILDVKPINSNILNFYDKYTDIYIKYNLEKNTNIKIIYKYIIFNNKSYSKDKKQFKINNNVIISNYEKKYFNLEEYSGFVTRNNYFNSLINFYYYSFKFNNITQKYIIVPENDFNNEISNNCIKTILEKNQQNNSVLYIILNNYFKIENKEIFIGYNKNSHKKSIEYKNDTNEIFYYLNDIKYKIISKLDHIHKNFYNLLTHNDDIILSFTDENDYYIQLNRYNIIFKIECDKIYYIIDYIKYEVIYYDNELFNNNGILKLKSKDKCKLLCFYNYNLLTTQTEPLKYIFKKKLDDNKIKMIDEYLKKENKYFNYYFTIIDYSNCTNEYILQDYKDLWIILLNCLYYNNSILLLKLIRQIQLLIINNDYIENFIEKLFFGFGNIYTLPIKQLLFEKQVLNKYNYDYYNRFIYNNINLKINIEQEENFFEKKSFIINYNKLKFHIYSYIFYIEEKFPDIIYDYENSEYIKRKIILTVKRDKIGNYVPTKKNFEIIYDKIDNFDENYHLNNFQKLLIYNIKSISKIQLDKNIEKSKELYKYLIDPCKQVLYPIQELIMGIGKSSSITPYICLLLLNYFINSQKTYNKEIFIVMPYFLINQSFKILLNNLFSIFKNVDILIYDRKPIFTNSNRIILISDENYKLMFLKENIDTTDKYMIYDEVDFMANPMTCELNISQDKTNLENDEFLYIICECLYEKIFVDKLLWEIPGIFFDNNSIHNYIFDINEQNIKTLYNFFNKNIYPEIKDKSREIEIDENIKVSMLDYIKKNIFIFLLTQQYKVNYGIPDKYYNVNNRNYKFKAIPYSAVDNPVMGSEFSDPMLTYILTFISYKLMDFKYRSIDNDIILEIHEKLYLQKPNEENQKNLFNLLKNNPINFDIYRNNKEFYKIFKEKIIITEDNYKIFMKNILNLNNFYYKKSNNISFNDLLLYKNVKNFVSFTGTAYIKPPVSNNINFQSNYINREIDIQEKIREIINNECIVNNIYMNRNENLVEDVFKCINNYNVLIDIGAIFVAYSNEQFIKRYKEVHNRKKYIIYFDDGIKILDLDENIYVNMKKKCNDCFFFFNNKHITGVDAKEIMPINSKALITITNNTNMRDFSQGIYRLRDIENGQICDLIINSKIIKNNLMIGGCLNFDLVTDESDKRISEKIKNKIIKNLIKKQKIIDKIKLKILLKQNIIALLKSKLNNNIIELYSDPGTSDYINDLDLHNIKNIISNNTEQDFNNKMQEIISSEIDKSKEICTESGDKKTFKEIIKSLLINYKLLETNHVNICTNQQQNLQIDIDLILLQQTTQKININTKILKLNNLYLCHNLYYRIGKQSLKRKKNIFFFLLNLSNPNTEIYIIYNHEINNILVIELKTLNNLLENNPYEEFYKNNTIILISNYEDYGKEIEKELKQLIIFCFKAFINELNNSDENKNLEKYLYNTKEEYKYFNENKEKILCFNKSFIKFYI